MIEKVCLPIGRVDCSDLLPTMKTHFLQIQETWALTFLLLLSTLSVVNHFVALHLPTDNSAYVVR